MKVEIGTAATHWWGLKEFVLAQGNGKTDSNKVVYFSYCEKKDRLTNNVGYITLSSP